MRNDSFGLNIWWSLNISRYTFKRRDHRPGYPQLPPLRAETGPGRGRRAAGGALRGAGDGLRPGLSRLGTSETRETGSSPMMTGTLTSFYAASVAGFKKPPPVRTLKSRSYDPDGNGASPSFLSHAGEHLQKVDHILQIRQAIAVRVTRDDGRAG